MFSKIVEEKALYMVVDGGNIYIDGKKINCRYAFYRIDLDAKSLSYRSSSTDQDYSLLNEPVLLLGVEFPRGMVFFSFGSKIYMLGSRDLVRRSCSVFVYDTVSGELGAANQHLRTPKNAPIVIQPVKPFDDRVFVLSEDLCGHDLEVFYPGDEDSSWTFIGAPSCFILQQYCRVVSHATALDGFLLLMKTNVVFYYNMHKNIWRIVIPQSPNFLFLQPRVFAHDMAMWFHFCNDSFLCGYHVDSNIGKLPLLYLDDAPASVRSHRKNNLLYLGDSMFCLVRSGFDRFVDPGPPNWRSTSDRLPCHHAVATLFQVDPFANAILEQRSYQILKVQDVFYSMANVCACFVI
ncbi:uncharacterized protein LOC132311178 [Cornus florida]|uniref:uncharacterized protein LOC132311178 n=1 Tax=Cornus florida TaxID=4283 RepID=UPI0028A03262|nr:uncharacterized protein LOC132311178 [Cornus florida]XP_059664931.1 uncharacterized protein LOC132311178 [Cornus florida]XP_059664932.1 uncharacterized protein LOC132311178 [Cornus florida]XP_059664933.1 uncharacterized protein LOC132311178 [Cornus florida]XP_059664934.1 uncharacterized protein LOC132311178 [Cornus florida]